MIVRKRIQGIIDQDRHAYMRVTLDGTGTIQPAGDGVKGAGTLPQKVVFANEKGSAIIGWQEAGSRKMVANAAIALFAEFDWGADGKIKPVGGGTARGQVVGNQAAAVDGDVVEVILYE